MNLEIYLSDRCNFGCPYCCVSTNAGPAARISAEKAKKGIDHFLGLEFPKSGSERQIYFLGGEPLLDFPVIRASVDHVRSRDKAVGIRVYTNGSLLTRPIVDYLEANGVQLWISLDGAKETNDQHRTVFGKPQASSFDAVLKRILQIGPERLTLNVVVHPDTAPQLPSDIEYFVKLGIGSMNIQPELYAPYSAAQLRGLDHALGALRRYYRDFTKREGRVPFVMPILFAMLESFSRLGENVAPWWKECENLVLGADGGFYACERLLAGRYDDPALKEFAIGDVEVGPDLVRKERWMQEARRYLYRRGERSREHYHCPKGDYLFSKMKGRAPDPLLDGAHKVSRAFCRQFLGLAADLDSVPAFRSVYVERRQGGAADAVRPERLTYAVAAIDDAVLGAAGKRRLLGILANEVFFERLARCGSWEELERLGERFEKTLRRAEIALPKELKFPRGFDVEFRDGSYEVRVSSAAGALQAAPGEDIAEGVLLIAAKRFMDAEKAFAKSPAPWGDLLSGFCCSQSGKQGRALFHLRRAAAGGFGWIRALYGRVGMDRGNATAAREIEKGRALGPAHGWLDAASGWARLAAGDARGAAERFSAALKGSEPFVGARLELAGSFLERGRSARARQELRAYLRQGPRFAQPLYLLSRVEAESGRAAAALSAAVEASRLDRRYVWERNATSVASENRHHGLPLVLWPLAEHAKAPPELLAWRGQTRLTGKDPLGAVRDLSRARSLEPRDGWTRIWLAEALRRLGFFSAALQQLEPRGLRVGPWEAALRGACMVGLGRWKEACEQLDSALAEDAQCGRGLPHAWRGEARLRSQGAGAEADFQRAREWNPHWAWLREAGGAMPSPSFGAPPGLAGDALERALRERAFDPSVYKARALRRFETGDWVGAVADCSRVLEEELSPWDAWAYDLRARAKEAARDPAAAQDHERARVLDECLARS